MTDMPIDEPKVVWVSSGDRAAPRPEYRRTFGDAAGERFAARVVLILFLACMSLAVYDLYLLLVGLR